MRQPASELLTVVTRVSERTWRVFVHVCAIVCVRAPMRRKSSRNSLARSLASHREPETAESCRVREREKQRERERQRVTERERETVTEAERVTERAAESAVQRERDLGSGRDNVRSKVASGSCCLVLVVGRSSLVSCRSAPCRWRSSRVGFKLNQSGRARWALVARTRTHTNRSSFCQNFRAKKKTEPSRSVSTSSCCVSDCSSESLGV